MRAGVVVAAEDYAWSSARPHVLGEDDFLLAPGRPYPGPVEDWREWLRSPVKEEEIHRLRQATHSGRPCGSAGLVSMLEKLLGRRLLPAKPGRPKKGQGKSAEGKGKGIC